MAEKTTTTFFINTDLHHKFKLACVEQGKSMSQTLELLIEKHLKSDGQIK